MIESYANYEWFLKENLKAYSGKWIAIVDKKVVAVSNNIDQIIQQTKQKYPNKKPLITKVKDKLSIL